jgi:hypothetical protein
MEGIRRAPDNYVRNVDPFPELNVPKVTAQLDPRGKGTDAGKKNLPPANADQLSDAETEIVNYIELERTNSHGALVSQLQTFEERIATLDFEGRFAVVRSASVEAVSEFKVESLQGQDRLHSLRRHLLELEQERDEFRKEHRLKRTAHYPSRAVWTVKIAAIFVLFTFEVVLNGIFLSKGSDLGLIGGITEAASFAALNVLATAIIGFFFIRWIFRRSVFAKLVGLISLTAYIAFALLLNLALAHYREVSGTLMDSASAEIISRLSTDPLGLTDIKSWLFFGIGVLISLATLLDVLTLDDRYPGYGALDRRLEKAREDYIGWKNHLFDNLRGIRGDATTALGEASRDLSVRRSEYESIIEQRPALVSRYKSHVEHLQRVCNNLLNEYRAANKATRTEPPPSYFETHRYSIDLSSLEELTRRPDRVESVTAAITEAQQSLKEQLAAIHAAYEEAARVYSQLDTLVDGIRVNASSTA